MEKFYFECIDCGRTFSSKEVTYLCKTCEITNNSQNPPRGVLKVIYDYLELKKNKFSNIANEKYLSLLPILDNKNFPNLQTGETPCYKITQLNNQDLPFELHIKDDSQNPTFSFKDRASAVVSAYAKENSINTIVAASTGNAGSSLAGICASQKQKAIIFVPASAPKAKLTQIVMYGATIVPVAGTYDNAFDLSIEATKQFGWYNRNTAFNPFTIEGKKTVSLEIFSQFGKNLPDRIFVPVGDGVIISGVYKGFEDLLKMDLIKKMPIIIAVQAEGSSNIVDNLNNDIFTCKPSQTVADSISVDIPRNFYMAKKFLNTYHGEAIKVSDIEILEASSVLSKNTGIFSEPAAVAAFAGLLKYQKDNKIQDKSQNMVLLTGSGLKDLNSVQSLIKLPEPMKPELSEIKNLRIP